MSESEGKGLRVTLEFKDISLGLLRYIFPVSELGPSLSAPVTIMKTNNPLEYYSTGTET